MLKLPNIDIDSDVSWRGFASSNQGEFIQATHKPFCVQHYFQKISSEPMIFLDADCLFRARVEEQGFDIGVTLRSYRVDKTNPINGILNAGVILFNTYSPEFLERWITECKKENTTDQKALSEMLSETIDWNSYNKTYDWHGLKIKVFGTDEYNDYRLKDGKILHFKGDRHKPGIYEKLIAGIESGQDLYAMFKDLTGEKHSKLTRILRTLGIKS